MKGKKVLVVGGSSGIGLALAKRVSKKGGKVVIASRKSEEQKSELVKDEWLKKCDFISVDITSSSDINEMLLKVGEVDHIVITVKSPLVTGMFTDLDSESVHDAFNTKLWGQYNIAKFGAKKIKHGGSIVLTSGSLGTRPVQDYSTMSVICGAVNSLCKSLALELAPIRVNAVAPGFLTLKTMEDIVPLGLGDSDQLANSYMFLMEDSYTTGTTVVSDGGATLV